MMAMNIRRDPRRARLVLVPVTVLVVALMPGCRESPETSPGATPAAAPSRSQLVQIAEVRRENIALHSTHSGTLKARRTARIFNQEEGRITEFPLFEGDHVEAGTVVATFDDALLQARLAKAVARRRKFEADADRLRRLVQSRLTTQDELAQVQLSLDVAAADETELETRISYMTIRAPLTGIVTERLAEPGDVIPANRQILTIVDPDSLVTEIQVSELLIPHLQLGQEVIVSIDALGPDTYRGRILRIHPTVDPLSRRGTLEVVLDPVPQGAQPGQLCRVTIRARSLERRVVPFSAVRRDRTGEYVMILDASQSARRRTVETGLRLAQRIEIIEGVEDGERVIVRGFLGLDEGDRVEIVTPPS